MDNNNNDDLDKNLIESHNYDGIQELDNPLPAWWQVTFYGAIIFSFLYFLHYHMGGGGLSSQQELAQDLKHYKSLAQSQSTSDGKEITVESFLGNAAAITAGQKTYAAMCASCHGNAGEGSIGPNLTDKYWIHGKGEAQDILTVINKGVLEKGMPAWGQMVSKEKVMQLTAFVQSLKGTNPANSKKPEGTKIE